MSPKYTITENFKSTEEDRKTSFLSKLAKIINGTIKYPTEKNERWNRI